MECDKVFVATGRKPCINEKILGAHIFGPGASELLGEIGLAINNGLTVQEIAHTIHNHPSISELIVETAHVLKGLPIHTV